MKYVVLMGENDGNVVLTGENDGIVLCLSKKECHHVIYM